MIFGPLANCTGHRTSFAERWGGLVGRDKATKDDQNEIGNREHMKFQPRNGTVDGPGRSGTCTSSFVHHQG